MRSDSQNERVTRQLHIAFALGVAIGSLGCRDDANRADQRAAAKPRSQTQPMTTPDVTEPQSVSPADMPARDPKSETVPRWIPTIGVPLPGHGSNSHVIDPTVRPLTSDELLTIAYRYHPQLGNPENYTIEAWDRAFWNAPEQIALAGVQRAGYSRLSVWQELRDAVARSVPPGYIVAERTYPRYDPAYVIVVDAPVLPGSIEERFLVMELSYLVPYYFYYELHSRRVDGLIRRDPLLYEVTPVFEQVLAALEREIEARYGYWRLSPDVAALSVPGVEINGFHEWEKHPPTLQDALFTPSRW